MRPKLLFIEDETDLGNVVKQYLEIMGFEVTWCTNGNSAFAEFTTHKGKFDLLIIDIQLPDISGFDLAKRIQQLNQETSFLFLTARNEKQDRLLGLKIGADDYICKPFDIEEFILRIKNILRRNSQTHNALNVEDDSEDNVSIGDIILKKDLLTLTIAGRKPDSITLREAELLEYLCSHPNKILKREFILIQLWGQNDYFLGRSLDVFISRLRKLLKFSSTVSIDNVYGIGFIFTVNKNVKAGSQKISNQ
ncbi:DNA-binding response OmpR family regulator [Arcticibacter tournemirensis]|uniref:Response regulator transcription factor n=1 Tax=Arcticibacter tournemirensis TaxID=699437 RepID=A0A5M9GWM3_9SPHI|nr:response regulator transcription factor [Arcticibacter tournemirensis]KAA8477194.1 response regulator transcription factor [Arcticibacter tournemirensis]TQM50190.1 DNA-binding response OmpR family regulator [Arcticibacter tournemirensis]